MTNGVTWDIKPGILGDSLIFDPFIHYKLHLSWTLSLFSPVGWLPKGLNQTLSLCKTASFVSVSSSYDCRHTSNSVREEQFEAAPCAESSACVRELLLDLVWEDPCVDVKSSFHGVKQWLGWIYTNENKLMCIKYVIFCQYILLSPTHSVYFISLQTPTPTFWWTVAKLSTSSGQQSIFYSSLYNTGLYDQTHAVILC